MKTIELSGQQGRIDKVLTDILQDSRSTIQKLIQDGLVMVDGQVVKSNFKVQGSEVIHIKKANQTSEEELQLIAQDIPLDIVYEDEDILVINKAKGMVVHPSKGHPDGTLMNAVAYYLGDKMMSDDSQSLRPGLVHRIDKDTSGLLVLAKHKRAHETLAKQLTDHSMLRIYEAIVFGHFKAPHGTIDIPLRRQDHNRLKYGGHKEGKPAITHFRVLAESNENISLVECHLETGRTHQIRAHMEHIGHPIVGDPLYQTGRQASVPEYFHNNEGQLLHAKKLTLKHPRNGDLMTFEAPFPKSFTDVSKKLFKSESID